MQAHRAGKKLARRLRTQQSMLDMAEKLGNNSTSFMGLSRYRPSL